MAATGNGVFAVKVPSNRIQSILMSTIFSGLSGPNLPPFPPVADSVEMFDALSHPQQAYRGG